MTKRIQSIDWQFFQWANRLGPSPRYCKACKMFVRLGDGWFWLPVAAGVLFVNSLAEFFAIIGQCLAVLAISLNIYLPVKLGVRRLRPFQQNSAIAAGVPPLDKFSFPSGHTMHNLAVGLMLAHFYPKMFWPFTVLPFAWGFFRILFGVHFLSDILVGGALGACSFLMGQWIFK